MKKGFTLIELLVSMTIFLIVMVSIIELFISGIKTQKKCLALQTLSDDTSYVIEYMSRTIRMAKKDLTGEYISAGCNFETFGDDEIRFLNYEKEKQSFILDSDTGQIKEKKDDAPGYTALTSENVQVNKLSFDLSDEFSDRQCQTDNLQPRVTITMEIQTKEVEPQTLNIQTTISQRDLDVKY